MSGMYLIPYLCCSPVCIPTLLQLGSGQLAEQRLPIRSGHRLLTLQSTPVVRSLLPLSLPPPLLSSLFLPPLYFPSTFPLSSLLLPSSSLFPLSPSLSLPFLPLPSFTLSPIPFLTSLSRPSSSLPSSSLPLLSPLSHESRSVTFPSLLALLLSPQLPACPAHCPITVHCPGSCSSGWLRHPACIVYTQCLPSLVSVCLCVL